jgi:hypothetical protein
MSGEEKKIQLLEGLFGPSKNPENLVSKAAENALKNPRIYTYAPIPRIVFETLKLMNPTFSIPAEVRKALNEWVKNNYPELYNLAKEELKKRKLEKTEEKILKKIEEEETPPE